MNRDDAVNETYDDLYPIYKKLAITYFKKQKLTNNLVNKDFECELFNTILDYASKLYDCLTILSYKQ